MQKILDEIKKERIRQDQKWGGSQADDKRKATDWSDDIISYAILAKQMYKMGSPEKFRRRMLQIAALSVAALESFDRSFNKKTELFEEIISEWT